MSNYPLGSEWRKWDLQACTRKYTGYKGPNLSVEELAKLHDLTKISKAKINSEHQDLNDIEYAAVYIEYLVHFSDINVIAIANHNTASGTQAILDYLDSKKKLGGRYSEITVMPGVEIGAADRVHIVCVFNLENTTTKERYNYNEDGTKKSIKPWDDYIGEFLTDINIPVPRIENNKPKNSTDHNTLLILDKAKKWGFIPIFPHISNSDGWWKELQDSNRKEVYEHHIAGIFDVGSKNNQSLKKILDGKDPDFGNKCVAQVNSSDANRLTDIGSKFTWIKADPTFYGLLQILYEPIKRVRIQNEKPTLDYKKPFFSEITISGKVMQEGSPTFKNKTLPLNSDMVTLIGGRGTGKSILLDCIFKLFNPKKPEDQRLTKIDPDTFEVVYKKNNLEEIKYKYKEKADLEYLHVRQGEIKNIANNPEQLGKHIKTLLGIHELETTPDYDFEIASIIERIEKSLAWFELEDSEDNLKNNKEHNKKIIQTNQSLINTITTEQNKESITNFQNNNKKINTRTTSIRRLNELKSKISTYKIQIKRDIDEINNMELDGTSIPIVDFKPTENAVDNILKALSEKNIEFEVDNTKIIKVFRDQGIDQDIGGLLSKLDQYQKDIDQAENRINEFDIRVQAIQADIKERTKLVKRIQNDLASQLEVIKSSFKNITKGNESWTKHQKDLVKKLLKDINIDGQINFNTEVFYQGLHSLLNGQKFRNTKTESMNEKFISKFNVDSYETYLKLITNEKIISDGIGNFITLNEFAIQKDYFLKNNYDIYEYLYLHRYRQNYLSVKPVIEYLGKSPEKLSVGQRGTFYVCMKLATDPFGSPFVFDQPEDDLDNKFIMNELVPLFRELKKYRQILIATHNANLVVNADAEQIIIATNEDEVLSYESGSLENTSQEEPRGIREISCDILEGGKIAFEAREKKYGFEK